jgi:GT2 family glycosyltransferase
VVIPGRTVATVVNWNRPAETLECLQSLRDSVLEGDIGLIVVDNGSTDGSIRSISDWMGRNLPAVDTVRLASSSIDEVRGELLATWPFVAVIESPTNLGFAAGSNLGIRLSLELPGVDWVWLLNNDTVVREGAIDALKGCISQYGSVGLVGSTITEYQDRSRVQCAGGARHYYLLGVGRPALKGRRLSEVLTGPTPRFDYVSGTAMLMRTDMLRDVGLLNEDYFLYFEEIDYSFRAKKAGYTVVWCRDSVVHHKGGASAGSRSAANKRKTAFSEYHSNLSALRFTRRYRPGLFAPFLVLRFFSKLLHALATGRPYLVSPLVRAYRDYFSGG